MGCALRNDPLSVERVERGVDHFAFVIGKLSRPSYDLPFYCLTRRVDDMGLKHSSRNVSMLSIVIGDGESDARRPRPVR